MFYMSNTAPNVTEIVLEIFIDSALNGSWVTSTDSWPTWPSRFVDPFDPWPTDPLSAMIRMLQFWILAAIFKRAAQYVYANFSYFLPVPFCVYQCLLFISTANTTLEKNYAEPIGSSRTNSDGCARYLILSMFQYRPTCVCVITK